MSSVDMDTKDKELERSQYQKLKTKYAKPIDKPKKDIYCEVEFFIKCKGLHSNFERNGGSQAAAIANAEHSMDEKMATDRGYTYLELGKLMEDWRGSNVL